MVKQIIQDYLNDESQPYEYRKAALDGLNSGQYSEDDMEEGLSRTWAMGRVSTPTGNKQEQPYVAPGQANPNKFQSPAPLEPRPGKTSSSLSPVSEKYLEQAPKNIGESLSSAKEGFLEGTEEGFTKGVEKTGEAVLRTAGAAGSVIGAGLEGLANIAGSGVDYLRGEKTGTTMQDVGKRASDLAKVTGWITDSIRGTSAGETGQDVIDAYNSLPEDTKTNIDATMQTLNLVPFSSPVATAGKGVAKKALQGVSVLGKAAEETAPVAAKAIKNAPSLPIKAVEKAGEATMDVADVVTKGVSKALKKDVSIEGLTGAAKERAIAEQTAPTLNMRQRIAGMDEADVRVIRDAGEAKAQEYIDKAIAANMDVKNIGAIQHAGQKLIDARDAAVKLMNDTGSKIGKFREKMRTSTVPQAKFDEIIDKFKEELDKLNLTIEKGKVVQRYGDVPRVASKGDISALQELYRAAWTAKVNGTQEALIDLRNMFSNKINFAKKASEVSGSVDPLSRAMRSDIRQINIDLVGAKQAKKLDNYSNLKELTKELESVIDSKAGANYLIKRVISENKLQATDLLDTLKKFTGIDVAQEARVANVVSNLLANKKQKSIFSQIIDKGGVTSGAISRLKEAISNPEKAIKSAAKAK
jgi:hypothetical protein